MDPTKTPTWWREGYTPKYRFAYAGEGDTHLYDVTGFGDQGFTAQDLYGQTNATYYDPHNTDPQYQYDYQKFLTASSGEPGTGWALGDNAGQGQSIWGTLFSPENIAITAAGGILGAGAAGAAAQAAAAAGGGLGATLASNPSTYWAGLKAVQGLVGDQSAGSVLGTVGALGGTVVGAATGVPGLSTVGGVAGHQIGHQFESPQVQGVGGSFNSQAQGTGDARQVSARSQRDVGDFGDFNFDTAGGGGWGDWQDFVDDPQVQDYFAQYGDSGLSSGSGGSEDLGTQPQFDWSKDTGQGGIMGDTGSQGTDNGWGSVNIPGLGKVPVSVLASLLQGGGSLAGGLIQGNAAKDAAKTQAGAAGQGIQLLRDLYAQQQANQAPYLGAGYAALSRLGNFGDYSPTPVYGAGESGGGGQGGTGQRSQSSTAQSGGNMVFNSSTGAWENIGTGGAMNPGGPQGDNLRFNPAAGTWEQAPTYTDQDTWTGAKGTDASGVDLTGTGVEATPRSQIGGGASQPWAGQRQGGDQTHSFTWNPSQYQYTAPDALKASDYGYTPTTALDASQYQYQATQALDPSGYKFQPPTGSQVLTDDPGYQFRLSEGMKALERQGAAGGLRLSGAQLKAAQQYTQGEASQEYQNAYGRARDVNELNYGRAYQQNADTYQRGYQQDQTNYGRALQQNQDTFQRDYLGNQTGYERARNENQDTFQRGYLQNETGYNRGLQANQLNYQRGYQQNQDQYQRGLTAYNTNLGRLQSLAGLGQSGTQIAANSASNFGSSLYNGLTSQGAAQAAGQVGQANGVNSAISGVGKAADNYLSYNLLSNLMQQGWFGGKRS